MYINLKNIIKILSVLTIITLIAGCGADDDNELTEEEKLEQLYSELVGTYSLIKSEVTFTNQPTQTFVPPEAEGTMTITSDQRITQEFEVFGIRISLKGSFEINIEESILIIDNDDLDLDSIPIYTWDGETLTTTLDAGTFVEKDFWRKQ